MEKTVYNRTVPAAEFFEIDISGRSAHHPPATRPRKKIFPAGIFLMLFMIETCLAAGGVLAYFYYTGKSKIGEIESYTADYLVPLAEAFGQVAELNYRARNYSRLRTLFQEKMEQRIIEEAFFVLKNGKVVAHSNPEYEKKSMGNIAGDEFAYNMDQIMKPVNQKSRDVLFADYNIVSRPAPFDRDLRLMLKRYVYPKIDTTGWIVSRAVFSGKKPVGAVCLLVSKGRIYSFLAGRIDACLRMLQAALGISFSVSLLVTLVVLVRYRSIQKRALESSAKTFTAAGGSYDRTSGGAVREDEPIVARILEPAGEYRSAATPGPEGSREIKDPIPTGKER